MLIFNWCVSPGKSMRQPERHVFQCCAKQVFYDKGSKAAALFADAGEGTVRTGFNAYHSVPPPWQWQMESHDE